MATQSRRLMTRYSLLALLVSYLRTGSISNTGQFTTSSTAPGPPTTFPFTQSIWTFQLDQDLIQIRYTENDAMKLPVGVTLTFDGDVADRSHAMPQVWNTTIKIHVGVPTRYGYTSGSSSIAQLIDQALFQSGGRVLLTDYTQFPSVTTQDFLSWTKKPRGDWKYIEADLFREYVLEFEAQYQTSQGTGF